MQVESPSIHFIIPAYNPIDDWKENLCLRILELKKLLKSISIGVTLVNDGSSFSFEYNDFIQLTQNHINLQILSHERNLGKGAAVRTGLKNTISDIYLITDVDIPYTMESIHQVANSSMENHDVVFGFRKTEYYQKVPFFRKVISKLLRWMLKNIMNVDVRDSQCGLKAVNNRGKEVYLKTKINRYLYDLEFTKLVSKSDLKFSKINVELKPGIHFRKLSFRILSTELKDFFRIFLLH